MTKRDFQAAEYAAEVKQREKLPLRKEAFDLLEIVFSVNASSEDVENAIDTLVEILRPETMIVADDEIEELMKDLGLPRDGEQNYPASCWGHAMCYVPPRTDDGYVPDPSQVSANEESFRRSDYISTEEYVAEIRKRSHFTNAFKTLPNSVQQTTPTNCFRACVATVLNIPINDVPEACDGAEWDWDNFQDWLASKNMQAIEITFGNGGTIYPVRKPVICILTGKSPRECTTGKHAVVAELLGLEGFRLLHDPHPSQTWFDGEEPTHATFFVPISQIGITTDDEPIDEAFAKTMRTHGVGGVGISKCYIFDVYWRVVASDKYESTIYVRTRGELRDAVALAERLRK